MHHLRKFVDCTLFSNSLDEHAIDLDTITEEENPASQSFVWILRQLILKKVSELKEKVVPMLKGTKLRLENYFDVQIPENGKAFYFKRT